MARIRMIKPEMFDDPELGAVSLGARWLFAGLLTQADRRGRLTDEPKRLKVRLLPFDDCDVAHLIDELVTAKFVHRYKVDGKAYLQIRTFERHQRPHPREPESVLPPMSTASREKKRLAVKKHGQPEKETASPSESGFLILDSGEGGREHGRAHARRPPTHGPPLVGSHRSHACCGYVCLPGDLFSEFVRKSGRAEEDGRRYVSDWFGRVNTELESARPVIGDDAFRFWRHRWAQDHPTAVLTPRDLERQKAAQELEAWSHGARS